MTFNFKPLSNPILFVGDNPCQLGGLSRIGRDLATLTCTMPQFRVGYMGMGIGQKRKLPFILYDYPQMADFGASYIKEVWHDFAGNEPGIIMTLDDVSRREYMGNVTDPFYGLNRTFRKWMYTPIDSVGPNGISLPFAGRVTVSHFDRVMAASEWGCNVLKAGGREDADWLPHGISVDKFNIQGTYGPEKILVGCVMANQSRKDFPEAFSCFAQLLKKYGNRFHAWLHTDVLQRYWDVYELIEDYGLQENITVTVTLTDEELASKYRSCACTILPSGGEGFGYPIAESLACGTACVVADYAAGQELVEESCKVKVYDFKVETCHNVLRAHVSGLDMAYFAEMQIESKLEDWYGRSAELAASVEHLDWARLKEPWKKWMLGGLK